jgi:hypothetical protein
MLINLSLLFQLLCFIENIRTWLIVCAGYATRHFLTEIEPFANFITLFSEKENVLTSEKASPTNPGVFDDVEAIS